MGWGDALPTLNYTPIAPIGTVTYDGTGQATEPCVKFFPGGWNGYRYWMAMNPIPGGDASYENPSIIVSNDGETWLVPPGGTNPIAAAPTSGNNADAAIGMSSDGLTMYLYWDRYDASVGSNTGIYCASSTNGTTWTTPTKIVSAVVGGGVDVMEPKLVWDGSQYRLYIADLRNSGPPTSLYYKTASSPAGPWTGTNAVTINGLGTGNYMWHYDVIREANGRYVMALCDTQTAKRVWLASSWDGVTFTAASRPLATTNATWCSTGTYRPSIAKLGHSHYGLWMGGTAGTTWRIGFVTIPSTEIP